MTNDADFTTQEWTYAGRRFLRGNKIYHAWIDAKGEIRYYDKAPRSAVVGGVYEVEATDSKARITGATFLRDHTDSRVTVWRIEDAAARNVLEAERAVKRATKENTNFGDLTLREIRDMIANQMPMHQQGTITAVLQFLNFNRR